MPIFDGLLIILCAGAAIYCHILSRQVKNLRDSRSGIAEVIKDMVRNVNDMQRAFDTTRAGVEEETRKLRDLIEEGVALSEYVENKQRDLAVLLQAAQTMSTKSSRKERTDFGVNPDVYDFGGRVSSGRTGGEDPLADVAPKDFDPNRRSVKKPRSFVKIDGEEYI